MHPIAEETVRKEIPRRTQGSTSLGVEGSERERAGVALGDLLSELVSSRLQTFSPLLSFSLFRLRLWGGVIRGEREETGNTN